MGGRNGIDLMPVKPIPYGRQSIDDGDIAAVASALRGDWLTQGPTIAKFERALAEYCGAEYAVAVVNGTVALHLACLAAGLGPGDEGITSPITFLASANCMIYCGAKPVFADIDGKTWNIDAEEIKKRITRKSRVIIPVHFAGLPCNMEAIRELALAHGLVVIEDACHALGSTYQDAKIGACAFSDMTVFSFHPVKHITTGEGGAILTNDIALARRLYSLRHHGITQDPDCLEENHGPWYYETQELGFNARITDIQCALGISQLSKIDVFIERRRWIAQHYRRAFADIKGLTCQAEIPDAEHAYHLFPIHLDSGRFDRKTVYTALRERGILTQVHYVPVHRQPFIRKISGDASLPRADEYYSGCLSLPIFPSLRDEELIYVEETVKEILSKNQAG